MSQQAQQQASDLLSAESVADIDRWIAKYPAEQRQAAVMAALRIVQDQNDGSLTTELMDAVADYLGMPAIAVYEVATFFSMYEMKPVGQHKICVCNSISCMLNGSEALIESLKTKFGIDLGEVTGDGKYSIKEVECLGACANAPVVQIGTDYHENLTEQKLDQIVDGLE
ncbi:NAD(P)H-dependent oxidoreductase subunit E [Solemya pervernicosa gill symbiont]|uniref:NADH-quinone oxidoreductase subunit E n=2 Tax=Gammaproteobacteria incertae sedis TaxID=118884 RepID=A0A1T2L9H1_9GAMM|nr:NAD(P)H-dependent oxidoreductase subunit E [Candidatus Reidiella endopervernicosa]OOZ41731.1 NAD(P)H-dependent oxidoreductase subunit E [Solemya pervernicosa gill symbiont]QKQ26484.1 NAD(P)H-dependent oxidoreductase subunit E [Candidatus Reidiella endopervernicosa]